MRLLRRSVLPRLRFGLLLATALLVLGLNQRSISVLRLAAPASEAPRATPPRATVIKQKVTLEATAALAHFVVPRAGGVAARAGHERLGPGHAAAAGGAAPPRRGAGRRGVPGPAAGRSALAAGALAFHLTFSN